MNAIWHPEIQVEIDEGVDFRWVDSEHANERLGVLQELKRKLESTPPAPVPIDELVS